MKEVKNMKNSIMRLYVFLSILIAAILTTLVFLLVTELIFIPKKIEEILFYITFTLFYGLSLNLFLKNFKKKRWWW